MGTEIAVGLAERGYSVVLFSRFSKGVPLDICANNSISCVRSDFSGSYVQAEEHFREIPVLIDATSDSSGLDRLSQEKMISGILELAHKSNCVLFLYLSTFSLYEKFGLRLVDENDDTRANSPYLESKIRGEKAYADAGFASSSVLRIGAPVGRGMPPNRLFSSLCRSALAGDPMKLMADGSRSQQYLDLRDLTSAIDRLIKAERVPSLCNVVGAQEVSNFDLAHKIRSIAKSTSKIEITTDWDRESGKRFAATSLSLAEIGYEPSISLENSIQWVLDDYRA